MNTEHETGWINSRHDDPNTREPIEDFDFEAFLDEECFGENPEDEIAVCAQILNEILHWCFQHGGLRDGLDLQPAFRNFCCIVWLLRPDLLSGVSLAQLAPMLGATRQALSKTVRRYGDAHGLRNRLMKRESSRQAYRKAQNKRHRPYKRKAGASAMVETPADGGQSKQSLHPCNNVNQFK